MRRPPTKSTSLPRSTHVFCTYRFCSDSSRPSTITACSMWAVARDATPASCSKEIRRPGADWPEISPGTNAAGGATGNRQSLRHHDRSPLRQRNRLTRIYAAIARTLPWMSRAPSTRCAEFCGPAANWPSSTKTRRNGGAWRLTPGSAGSTAANSNACSPVTAARSKRAHLLLGRRRPRWAVSRVVR